MCASASGSEKRSSKKHNEKKKKTEKSASDEEEKIFEEINSEEKDKTKTLVAISRDSVNAWKTVPISHDRVEESVCESLHSNSCI